MVQKIPTGFATVTPSLVLDGASDAMALYKKAFGAVEESRMHIPGTDKIVHACISIGSSKIFLCDRIPKMCPQASQSSFYLYFEDVDAAYKRAVEAGLTSVMPPTDMFWGDRVSAVTDRFGISWTIASHVRDVSEKELIEGQKQFMAFAG